MTQREQASSALPRSSARPSGLTNGHAPTHGAAPVGVDEEPDEHEVAAARAEARYAAHVALMDWVGERFEERFGSGGPGGGARVRKLWVPPLDDSEDEAGGAVAPGPAAAPQGKFTAPAAAERGAVVAGSVPSTSPRPSVIEVARVLADDRTTAMQILGGIDVAELVRLELPKTSVLVPGLIPVGTTLLIAPPKIGKSVLMYQLMIEAALGGSLFGRQVNGGVPARGLYLALEDSAQRGQERSLTALHGRELPVGRLMIAWECPPLGGGLEDVIESWLDELPAGAAALIGIDTLGKARGPGQAGDERRNAYQVDVRDLATIQHLVISRGVSLVIVHHTKKGVEDDFVASASGTYGIAGSADTILSLERKRNQAVGVLRVTSRSLPEDELPVAFRGLEGWYAAGAAEAALALLSPEAQAVLDVLLANAPAAMTAAAVAEAMGGKAHRRTVAYHLAQLADESLAVRVPGGYVATMGLPWEGSLH